MSSAGSGVTGGGASVSVECAGPPTANLVITGNTFTQNSIQTKGPTALAGGLYVADDGSGQLTATQSGNVFQSNSIVNTGSTATTFDGGGEWLASVNLTSSSDAYIGNSLPGPGTGSASEGAGLGVVRGNCAPVSASPTTATATNLVAAGNSIGAPSGGDVEGAGVYAGCVATTGSQGFALTLINSTVSGNSGPGGAAGVDGESADTLTLQNSIVASNTGTGASDLGGFGATPGANVTATSSDVCAIASTTAPFAGTGNICADPGLVSAVTGDVHETALSPTIDAAPTRWCRVESAPTSTDGRESSVPSRRRGSSTSARPSFRPRSLRRRPADQRRRRPADRRRPPATARRPTPRSRMW